MYLMFVLVPVARYACICSMEFKFL
jgi:hypothetical protein